MHHVCRCNFDDLVRVGRALARAFRPIKLNYQILGNLVPHLHAHVQPRYYGDPAPGRPLDPSHRLVPLTDDEYRQRVQAGHPRRLAAGLRPDASRPPGRAPSGATHSVSSDRRRRTSLTSSAPALLPLSALSAQARSPAPMGCRSMAATRRPHSRG
jgi:hypothetical protein